MLSRSITLLLVLAPLALRAQPAPATPAAPAAPIEHGTEIVVAPGPANLDQIIKNPASLAEGRRLFQTHCTSCHGPNGEGARGASLLSPNLPRVAEAAVAPAEAPGGGGGRGRGRGANAAAATDGPPVSPYDRALQQIIQRGIPATEMQPPRLQPGELPLVAAFVKSLGQLPPEPVPGNASHGAELFKTKGACMTCHMIRGEGAVIGPDLSDVGRARGVAYMRRALTDPNADVPKAFQAYRNDISLPQNFLFVRAVTKNGETIGGVRVNEDTFSIQLRDLTGKVRSFFKSELSELHKEWGQSPMPNYSAVFAPGELDDVVAFLVSQRGGNK